VPAVITACAGKAVGEDAAFQVFGKRLAHIGLGGVVIALSVKLACAGQLKPALVVLGYGLVEQRALRVAWIVELGLGDGHAAMSARLVKHIASLFGGDGAIQIAVILPQQAPCGGFYYAAFADVGCIGVDDKVVH
jgi:hypothetical protein